MAGQKQSKAKGRKINRNIAKCAAYRSSGRREAHKARKVERDLKLKARGDSQVSANCLKKRHERRRNSNPAARREATFQGERQFGDDAKGHHIHQREHGLATALTPGEFKAWERLQKAQKTEVISKTA